LLYSQKNVPTMCLLASPCISVCLSVHIKSSDFHAIMY
jgi:hypothetical protein